MAEPREMVAEPTEAGTLGRPLLRFAAIALGAIGLAGIAAAILLTVEALLESAGGGIGSFAVFAIPYFVVLFIVATFVFATARAVARGEFLRTGACMAVIVASIALIFATNGQWFRRGLDFETHRCGAKSCYVLYGASSPRAIAIGAIPVAIWGALAAAAIAADAFRKVGGRRSVAVASAVAMVAISVGGVYGVASGARSDEHLRLTCARVLAIRAGEYDPWTRPHDTIARSFFERCTDPVSVAASLRRKARSPWDVGDPG